MTSEYRFGIFLAGLDPTLGSEQKGVRPVLVISGESFNELMPVVTILPITSLKPGRKIYSSEVLLRAPMGGLTQDSLVLAHQVRTISKQRLIKKIGDIVSSETRESILESLKTHLEL